MINSVCYDDVCGRERATAALYHFGIGFFVSGLLMQKNCFSFFVVVFKTLLKELKVPQNWRIFVIVRKANKNNIITCDSLWRDVSSLNYISKWYYWYSWQAVFFLLLCNRIHTSYAQSINFSNDSMGKTWYRNGTIERCEHATLRFAVSLSKIKQW